MGALVILLSNISLICSNQTHIESMKKGQAVRYTRECCHDTETAPAVFSRNGGTGTLGGWWLGESSAALSTLMFGGFAFQAFLPSLIAARNAVGARKLLCVDVEKREGGP